MGNIVLNFLTTVVLFPMASVSLYGVVSQPTNVTILHINPTSVIVQWRTKTERESRYEIVYKPVKANYRVILEVNGDIHEVPLPPLEPTTEYQVHVSSINGIKRNDSNVVFFTTETFGSRQYPYSTGKSPGGGPGSAIVRPEEITIVLVVFIVWIIAVALFCNRWGKIRILEPYAEPFDKRKLTCPNVVQHHCPNSSPPFGNRPLYISRSLDPCGLYTPESHRPRKTSVFVNSPSSFDYYVDDPRKARSAMDIATLATMAYCSPNKIMVTREMPPKGYSIYESKFRLSTQQSQSDV